MPLFGSNSVHLSRVLKLPYMEKLLCVVHVYLCMHGDHILYVILEGEKLGGVWFGEGHGESSCSRRLSGDVVSGYHILITSY